MIRFCGIFSLSLQVKAIQRCGQGKDPTGPPLWILNSRHLPIPLSISFTATASISPNFMRLINAPFKKKVDTVPASLKGTPLEAFLHAREKWQSPWGHAALQQSLDSWKGQSNVAYRCARGLTADAPSWLGPGLCAVCADGGGDWWSVLSSVQIKRL